MKRIDIIGSAGIPSKYGGFETLAENLVSYLGLKYDFTVYCQSSLYEEKSFFYKGAKLKYVKLRANGVQSILYDLFALINSSFKSDVILLLGISAGVFLPFIRLISNVKIITNPDGIEWKREKWSFLAKCYLKFSEFIAVKFSHVIISDNRYIQKYIYDKYSVRSEFIAYGGDHSIRPDAAFKPIKHDIPFNVNSDYAFSVCRIEPENNVQMILEAFSQCELNYVIVGNWDSSSYGVHLKEKYNYYDNIFLLDSIYDIQLLNYYRANATIYIHGHSAGGSNPSLIEAMYMGLPCLCFDVSFNRATTFELSLYFKSSIDLLNQIRILNRQQLDSVAVKLEAEARKFYSWEFISSQYDRLIEGII